MNAMAAGTIPTTSSETIWQRDLEDEDAIARSPPMSPRWLVRAIS